MVFLFVVLSLLLLWWVHEIIVRSSSSSYMPCVEALCVWWWVGDEQWSFLVEKSSSRELKMKMHAWNVEGNPFAHLPNVFFICQAIAHLGQPTPQNDQRSPRGSSPCERGTPSVGGFVSTRSATRNSWKGLFLTNHQKLCNARAPPGVRKAWCVNKVDETLHAYLHMYSTINSRSSSFWYFVMVVSTHLVQSGNSGDVKNERIRKPLAWLIPCRLQL